ncbi:MAG: deoxyhypusine synthase [Sedimentisphaerales bacterium]|nr:deoxyhypusine synthase [Sedimentisphaerales bacterium]
MKHDCPKRAKYLSGARILPRPITKEYSVTDLIEKTFNAYNSGRIKDAAELVVKEYSKENVTVGMSLAGALTPAGMASSVIPLIEHGFVDWIVATGANMYHDMHYPFNLPLYEGSPNVDDCELREVGVTRIYDVLFDYENVLMETDRRLRKILTRKEFQKEMGTQEFYHHLGKILDDVEQENKLGKVSILASAYRSGVPVFTSSPGDSTLGMNIAGLEVLSDKFKLRINPSIDVNESTAIILDSKVYQKGKTAVILVGGGSPKNFMLQTEPQIQEILRIQEVGQDYFIQITDARVDTGGLSGATPKEAVTWGKIDPNEVEKSVIVYTDSTIALPLITSYVMQNTGPKKLKRLYDRREKLMEQLKKSYFENFSQTAPKEMKQLEELLDKNID